MKNSCCQIRAAAVVLLKGHWENVLQQHVPAETFSGIIFGNFKPVLVFKWNDPLPRSSDV